MKYALSCLLLLGCRPSPALRPVYDCTVLTVEQQAEFTQRSDACEDQACRDTVMVSFCKELP